MKRLFFDIETSPNIGFFWEAGWKLDISADSIITERAIICICFKWSDEKKVQYLVWDKKHSDATMLRRFISVLNEADETVSHNGDSFDITWIRTRCLKHGIPMMPSYVSIDTCKAARGAFRFNSNRLNYLGQFLGIGQKLHTGFELWKKIVLEDDPKALDQMVKYCKQDVLLLEKVWGKLNSYVPAKTHYGLHTNSCPECGSNDMKIAKHRVSAQGYHKVQVQCQKCGKYHTVSTSRFEKGKQI